MTQLISHILIIFYSITFLVLYCSGDNPTSIVKPYSGPDPGYILAESDGGLSNRLRVLASYMYIGQAKFEGAHLVFIWDKNEACPGHFLSVFEPIPTVVFATNMSRYVLDKNAKIVYENSLAVMPWILQMNHIPKARHGFPTWGQIEHMMYSRYFPTKEVMVKVNDYVQRHKVCSASAMHIRLTDMDKILGPGKRINVHGYMKFVESRPKDEKVFLITDNPDTQRHFLKAFGRDKILVYDVIASAEKQKPLFITTGNDTRVYRKNFTAEHRYTSLEHTVIDVLIAAHAHTFKPTPFSSLSELVKTFDRIGKRDRGWCS